MQFFDISKIITSLKSTYGKNFLDTITMQLHKAIGSQYTFIARIDESKSMSKTMAIVAENDFGENFEYPLAHTPCADVTKDTICVYPSHISDLYPKDQLLVDMGIEGYVGAPLHDSNGTVFGLVVALFGNPIENAQDVAALLELFAGRISAEVEREEKDKALLALNHSLEEKVLFRTQELENALSKLTQSQKQHIEQEKLASLGRLVAGVSHEVNTPLGVAILGNSTVLSGIQKLESKFKEGNLHKGNFIDFIADAKEASESVAFNLNRASELVINFKQIATDFHTDPESEIDLSSWIKTISTSLKPMLKKSDIKLDLNLPNTELIAKTYPSRLAQVLTNLISNVIKHAYPEPYDNKDKIITVSLMSKAQQYEIKVKDNGVGMDQDTQGKMLDPFFTTNRASGGMGLGMSIVHNLVNSSLNGQLNVSSEPDNGTTVSMVFNYA